MAINPAHLTAFEESAAFADRSGAGRLRVAGADALDLLNRLSTNRLDGLAAGGAASTVLANGDARVIDHLRAARIGGALWLLASPGQAGAVAEWIDLYTFGEDAAVDDRSAATSQFAVAGPAAPEILARAGLPAPPADGAAEGGEAIVVASPFGGLPIYDAILPLSAAPAAREALLAAGAAEANAETFEARRIIQGVPACGAEFGMFNNPLEARLLGSISDDKGCYTGQEVIARLQTYRKVRRLLMAFTTDGEAAPGDALLDEGGAEAGAVTSAFRHPRGETIGLALVAARLAIPGTRLFLAGGRGDAAMLGDPPYALASEPRG